jgi:hypothetical protein
VGVIGVRKRYKYCINTDGSEPSFGACPCPRNPTRCSFCCRSLPLPPPPGARGRSFRWELGNLGRERNGSRVREGRRKREERREMKSSKWRKARY